MLTTIETGAHGQFENKRLDITNDIITTDPATYVLSNYILVAKYNSISSIRAKLKADNESLLPLLERLLVSLSDNGAIHIDDDNITILKDTIKIDNPIQYEVILPELARIVCERAIKNRLAGHTQSTENDFENIARTFMVPRDPEIAKEFQDAIKTFIRSIKSSMAKHDVKSMSLDDVAVLNLSQAIFNLGDL